MPGQSSMKPERNWHDLLFVARGKHNNLHIQCLTCPTFSSNFLHSSTVISITDCLCFLLLLISSCLCFGCFNIIDHEIRGENYLIDLFIKQESVVSIFKFKFCVAFFNSIDTRISLLNLQHPIIFMKCISLIVLVSYIATKTLLYESALN